MSASPAGPSRARERLLSRSGYRLVAGVDEVGRGPLAGPVVAAAVILPPQWSVQGVNDSKRLDHRRRRTLSAAIKREALAWAVAAALTPGDRPHQHPPGQSSGYAAGGERPSALTGLFAGGWALCFGA